MKLIQNNFFGFIVQSLFNCKHYNNLSIPTSNNFILKLIIFIWSVTNIIYSNIIMMIKTCFNVYLILHSIYMYIYTQLRILVI